MTRQQILDLIKQTAEANGGVPLGEDRLTAIGLSTNVWGKYWPRLSAAQREAGFVPNRPNQARPEHDTLSRLAALARELGAIPTSRERIVKHQQDPEFPTDRVWKRLGPKDRLVARLTRFAETNPGYDDVLALCQAAAVEVESTKPDAVRFGSVYMLKGSGSKYKIGKTSVFGRRQRELKIQLPFETRKVHVIETDDPDGVEAYWHNRFAAKRGNGEWFDLDAKDVAAFKRWKRLK